jgi:integral membrane protein
MMTKARTIWMFRKIAAVEGWSYLALLFVAMPLKYWAGMTDIVPMVGMAHGWLFIAYMGALVIASTFGGLSMARVNWAILASLLPFGTFVHDPYLKREEDAARTEAV